MLIKLLASAYGGLISSLPHFPVTRTSVRPLSESCPIRYLLKATRALSLNFCIFIVPFTSQRFRGNVICIISQ